MLCYFFWDPSRAVFPWVIPFLERPILWYGLLFAGGFFLSYLLLYYLLRRDRNQIPKEEDLKKFADRLALYGTIGAILGARFFDMLFYQQGKVFIEDPLSLIRIWEGGLASHGGVLGILIALFIFQRRYPYFSWVYLVDLTGRVAGISCTLIRIGNFFNQEILGKPSDLPWAVLFGHPANGGLTVPLHPVQLYEALCYLILFFLTFNLKTRKEGKAAGVFITCGAAFRYGIEFFKEEQSMWLRNSPLTMGQWLSLPLLLFGVFLLLREKLLNIFVIKRE